MLEQRKRFLDKREAALRGADTHLLELKAELEQIVSRHEKLVDAEKKRNQAAALAKATLPCLSGGAGTGGCGGL